MSASPANALVEIEGAPLGLRLALQPANDCTPAPAPGRTARAEALYRRHRATVLGQCARLLRDRAAAEDATHETFLRVTRHIDAAPPGEQALWWISRIATNVCLNELRGRRTSAVPAGDVAALAGEDPAARSIEDAVSDRELVRRILESVPEKLRVVGVLRHVDGLYDAEIAGALGVARRTVVYRLKELKRRAGRRAAAG
jgi:RNA polymerase sigma-70 factor (ECF subfamily)